MQNHEDPEASHGPDDSMPAVCHVWCPHAETSASLLTPIYGHRDRMDTATGILKKDYWITDGLYGSFNCILYDGQNPQYQVRGPHS